MVGGDAKRDETAIYHESQSLQLCALHMLNNLFQRKAFDKADLDEICVQLTPKYWFNPHRSLLGLGNFDVNVIMAALQQIGYEAKWFDKRRSLSSVVFDKVFGFILNIPGNNKAFGFIPLYLTLGRKHWIAIKKVGQSEEYYNLDSTLKEPVKIGKKEDCLSYLQDHLQCEDKELLIVVSRQTAEEESWIVKS